MQDVVFFFGQIFSKVSVLVYLLYKVTVRVIFENLCHQVGEVEDVIQVGERKNE
jgi:hypothetical protein